MSDNAIRFASGAIQGAKVKVADRMVIRADADDPLSVPDDGMNAMNLLTTYKRTPLGADDLASADLASAEAMVNQAIRVAEAVMWAIYGDCEAAPASSTFGIAADHAGPRPRPIS